MAVVIAAIAGPQPAPLKLESHIRGMVSNPRYEVPQATGGIVAENTGDRPIHLLEATFDPPVPGLSPIEAFVVADVEGILTGGCTRPDNARELTGFALAPGQRVQILIFFDAHNATDVQIPQVAVRYRTADGGERRETVAHDTAVRTDVVPCRR